MEEEEFLTVDEAAEYLRVSPTTILRMVKVGRLKSYSWSYSAKERRYFKRKDIDAFLRK